MDYYLNINKNNYNESLNNIVLILPYNVFNSNDLFIIIKKYCNELKNIFNCNILSNINNYIFDGYYDIDNIINYDNLENIYENIYEIENENKIYKVFYIGWLRDLNIDNNYFLYLDYIFGIYDTSYIPICYNYYKYECLENFNCNIYEIKCDVELNTFDNIIFNELYICYTKWIKGNNIIRKPYNYFKYNNYIKPEYLII